MNFKYGITGGFEQGGLNIRRNEKKLFNHHNISGVVKIGTYNNTN